MLLDLFISDGNNAAWTIIGLIIIALPIGLGVLLLSAIRQVKHPAARLALSFVLLLVVLVVLANVFA